MSSLITPCLENKFRLLAINFSTWMVDSLFEVKNSCLNTRWSVVMAVRFVRSILGIRHGNFIVLKSFILFGSSDFLLRCFFLYAEI